MLLQLGCVVSNVVNLVQAEISRIPVKDIGEDLADAMEDDLPIGKGHVDGAFHGRVVVLAFRRVERCTRQFTV